VKDTSLIGTRLGPYRIQRELGSGGMGAVYLAQLAKPAAGLARRASVAVKIVHDHLLDRADLIHRFEREGRVGSRVEHPNVVRTFATEAVTRRGKTHYLLVMEYVEGRSLNELIADLGSVPEGLMREIARQAAAGLGAIHAVGAVHRDIKPENILITDDHEIRIMDLGVAKLQEASVALTREGGFAGSVLYAAPEQFREGDVGPAADLYSLGLLLYELATGQNPFFFDNVVAVIHAHLNDRPPSLRERNPDLSLFFSEVVETLLEKRPADRFPSAEDLEATLELGERSAWWLERAPAVEKHEALLPTIRVRRDARLHGRDDELRTLHEAWERARDGEGSTILVEGEAGIGKTRLVDAFLRELDEGERHVLYGAYPPSHGQGGLSEAILGKFGAARPGEALAPYLTVTPSLVPTFESLIKNEPPPADAEPFSSGALHTVVVHLIQALASEKPTVWVVEDLQFAPQESLDLLLDMARAVGDSRLLLVLTARPGVAVESFSPLENFRRLSLGRLGARDVIDLLEDVFQSEDLANWLAGKIARKSDGVPFFIFEMIRTLKEAGLIKQIADGSFVQTKVIDEIEVPSVVKDLIEARMRDLTEDQRAILDASAVQGMRFEPALIAEVLEEKKVRVLRQIAEIERRFGLVRGEGMSCAFDQKQVQEVLYGGLLPELRSEYHTLLAEAYAQRCGETPSGADAVFLAHHHLSGSRPQEARPHLEAALDHLARGFRNERLLDMARRGLATQGLLEGAERAGILLRQARCFDLVGRRDEQRAALDDALALAEQTGDKVLRGRVRQRLGVLFVYTGQIDAAQQTLREALELAREAGDKQSELAATGRLGSVLHAIGRYPEAKQHHERALALAREIGDRRGEAQAAARLGNIAHNLGQYEEARELHERSRLLCGEAGDRLGEVQATGNLGNILFRLGRQVEAKEHYERARDLSREVGHRLGEVIATDNLGGVLHYLGHAADAMRHHERSRTLSREIGDRVGEASAAANLGQVFSSLGRFAEAQAEFERSRALSRETGYRRGEAGVLALLATHAEAHRDGALAQQLFEEALALARELGEKSGVCGTLVSFGRFETEQGEAESAASHLDEAIELARETHSPDMLLAATVERARLPGGDVTAALAALAEHEDQAPLGNRMEVRFRLWELTQDPEHLAEAQRWLAHLRDHAPEEDRAAMMKSVPLHRDIMKAWEEQGAQE
jgi:serine/threonine protein kinase/tetratricopeptide (TPR) repeat protein